MSKIRHMSRLAAPKTWPINRKKTKWIAKPLPGAHDLKKSIALSVLMRDVIKTVDTRKQVRKLLNNRELLINGRIVKKTRLPIGLFDTVSIPKLKKYWRIIIINKKLYPLEISEKESEKTVLQIKNKTTLPKNKVQLNFSNGWNMIVKKSKYKTNQVFIFNNKKGKIEKVLEFKKKSTVYFVSGKHAGKTGKLIEIKEHKSRKEKTALVKIGKLEIETKTDSMITIGKNKSEIKLKSGK